MTTMENAAAAYAGESQANRKYSNFSEKAESEGFPMVAKLFKAASEAEAIHAKRLLFVMDSLVTFVAAHTTFVLQFFQHHLGDLRTRGFRAFKEAVRKFLGISEMLGTSDYCSYLYHFIPPAFYLFLFPIILSDSCFRFVYPIPILLL